MNCEMKTLDFSNLVGMTKAEAEAYCVEANHFLSINREDEIQYIHTAEMNFSRVSVDIDNGIVTKYYGVG